MLKIIVEFFGGPNDGKAFEGMLGDGSDAERYYYITRHGSVGHRFKVVSEFAVETLAAEQLQEETPHHFHRHYYVVTQRLEGEDEVCIRASYVEKQPASGLEQLIRKNLEQPTPPQELRLQKIRRSMQETARSMAESYSHWWPATAGGERRRSEPHLVLHAARWMLAERFTLFADARHSDSDQEAIDLLGFAPSQDWFLACQFMSLLDEEEVPHLLAQIERLESFWLSPRLTIPEGRDQMAGVARHCEEGFALVAGLHWDRTGLSDTELLNYWNGQPAGEAVAPLAEKLASLEAQTPEPLRIQSFAQSGTCYLLYAFFGIRR